jgi:membrane protein implicated in regulation of membrane protease activity
MDSSTAQAVQTVATVTGSVLLAWIAYKQARLSRTMETLEKQTNSIKDALVASTAKASRSEGVADGRAQVKAENQLPP